MRDQITKVLIIGQVWPEPTSSAAGTRMMQMIDLFSDYSWEITFASTAAVSLHSAALPSAVKRSQILLNSDSFDNWIQTISPDVVVFDRFMIEEQFGWRVLKYCPTAIRVLNTEDLHCLRSARQKAYKLGCDFSTSFLLEQELTKREIAAILRCDLSLIVSTYEIELLQNVFKIDEKLILYFPLFAKRNSNLPDFSSRNDFVFVGNFLHEPNRNAVKSLYQNVWPQLRKKIPGAALHVYGAYAPDQILQMNNPSAKFFVHGRATDSSAVVRIAKLVLAPLQFGAGIKGKFLEAMENGTPSITTTIGAEGMHHNMRWSGAIADNAADTIDAATSLYKDEAKWSMAQQYGFDLIDANFRKELYKAVVFDRMISLAQNLVEHRNANFIGSMLLHHTLRSTEYLSRWIEEKNNKKSPNISEGTL